MTTMIHRAHPKQFPHPSSVTVPWYLDESTEPTEPNSVRYTKTEDLLAGLQAAVDSALKRARSWRCERFQAANDWPAVLVYLDRPLELLGSTKAREIVLNALRTTHITGIYLALRITRADQVELRQEGAWGCELLEPLRRDDAGYVVYGNW